MKNKNKIIEMYRKYGFLYRKSSSNHDFLGFTYKSGFFNNAELVSISTHGRKKIEHQMQEKLEDLEKLGFSTKKSFYASLKELEDALFNGFFQINHWKEKIKNEYKQHCEKTLKTLPEEAKNYTYVDVPYRKNNISIENNIIEDICNGLNINEPQLSIIEAPAGFGKTSTSYHYCPVNKNELSLMT